MRRIVQLPCLRQLHIWNGRAHGTTESPRNIPHRRDQVRSCRCRRPSIVSKDRPLGLGTVGAHYADDHAQEAPPCSRASSSRQISVRHRTPPSSTPTLRLMKSESLNISRRVCSTAGSAHAGRGARVSGAEDVRRLAQTRATAGGAGPCAPDPAESLQRQCRGPLTVLRSRPAVLKARSRRPAVRGGISRSGSAPDLG